MDTEGLRACGQHCARPRRPRLRVGPLPGLGASALPASGRLSLGGERSGEPSVCPVLRRGPSGSEMVSSRWHPARARRSLRQQWLWF